MKPNKICEENEQSEQVRTGKNSHNKLEKYKIGEKNCCNRNALIGYNRQ